MAACRCSRRTLLSFYVVLVLFLHPATSLVEPEEYYVYSVQPALQVSKRSLSAAVVPVAQATTFVPSNASVPQPGAVVNATRVTTSSPAPGTVANVTAASTPEVTAKTSSASSGSSVPITSSSTNRSPVAGAASAAVLPGATSLPAKFPASTPSDTAPVPGNTTNSTDGDANNFPVFPNNQTLSEHNINKTEEDHHKYYNSTFIIDQNVGNAYWVNMRNRTDVKVNEMLSKSHRRAVTVRLSFDFPFYGHLVRNVTIATGGFLYTGEYIHSWLAATQYIAPLMANFDTSLSNTSFVKHVDNGTAFTVQWEKVVLQDRPESGDFTFQATLHSNGDIVFVYQHVPVLIEAIRDDTHPVKVGLSDAYIVDRNIFFVRRKTIYEYHRLQFAKEDIRNWTVIYLYALPTCVELKDCQSCLAHSIGFECQWCPAASRCSDGMDRYRQDWMYQECHVQNYTRAEQCKPALVPSVLPTAQAASDVPQDQPVVVEEENSGSVVGTIFIFLISGVAVLIFMMWVVYAYRNPHTASGQILIRYRPSQWRWRRGEARYTAATIHM